MLSAAIKPSISTKLSMSYQLAEVDFLSAHFSSIGNELNGCKPSLNDKDVLSQGGVSLI